MKGAGVRKARRGALVATVAGLLAAVLIAASLWHLAGARSGVRAERIEIDGTPATFWQAAGSGTRPVVVIAHGFAGSARLMESYALAFARAGFGALAYDLAGHGANPAPLSGDVARIDGATATLVAEMGRMIGAARRLGDGRVAVLGHSMAADIAVRAAIADGRVDATVGVSMASPAVTADEPANLLVLVGAREGALVEQARAAVSLALPPGEAAHLGVNHVDPSQGGARRAVAVPGVGHVGILFAPAAFAEASAWLSAVWGGGSGGGAPAPARGGWIVLLLAGCLLAAVAAARALPRVARLPAGAALGWRRGWAAVVLPAMLTPVLAGAVPPGIVPAPIADYLAGHLIIYGVLTAALTGLLGRGIARPRPGTRAMPFVLAVVAFAAFILVAVVWPVHAWLTHFVPTPGRAPVALALVAAALPFFLATEWLARGPAAPRFGGAAIAAGLLLSLLMAVALDPGRLFFLLMILPAVLGVVVMLNLLCALVARRTLHPAPGAIVAAATLGWGVAASFPLLGP
jgi:dienelactone hydrolase